jgi:2-dehydropantoate 2-reductase
MGERSVVLPLLNGIRHIDALTQAFGAKRVLGGVTVINAALLSDGSIQQSQVRINMNAIGELEGGCESTRCSAIKTALEIGAFQSGSTTTLLP